MKRDSNLAGLSREHLPALILAYRLRHGRSSNPAEPWPVDPALQRQAALDLIQAEIVPHFAAEEQILIPLISELSDPGPSQQVLAEHRAFGQLLNQIKVAEIYSLTPLLQKLGELLEAHIRFEERVWFEQLQQELSPQRLSSIGLALEAFKSAQAHTHLEDEHF